MVPEEIRSVFMKFSIPFENHIPWMYLDVKGLVTVGVGYLIDSPVLKNPSVLALDLSWHSKDGSPVTAEALQAEWWKIKKATKLSRAGAAPAKDMTVFRLSNAEIERTTLLRLEVFYEKLLESYPEMPLWPIPAQLATLSMAWAMGPGFPAMFPKFSTAVRDLDFLAAASECTIREAGNPGVIKRNIKNRALFAEAAKALEPAPAPKTEELSEEEREEAFNLVALTLDASARENARAVPDESETLSPPRRTFCFCERAGGTVLPWRSTCPERSSTRWRKRRWPPGPRPNTPL